MRHGSHRNTPTVAEVVRRAVEVCELEGDLLRLAARAELDGEPPPYVADRLALRGIEP